MPTPPPAYPWFTGAVRGLAALLHRTETTGLENIPPEGVGAVVSLNHESFIDAPLIISQIPHRFVRVMGAGNILDMPVVGPLMQAIGTKGVPSVRGKTKDPDASRKTMEDLTNCARDGELVLVLPEGAVNYWNRPSRLKEFHTGAVRIAAAAGVPLIPGALTGTMYSVPVFEQTPASDGSSRYTFLPFYLPVKILVTFGKPMEIRPEAAHDKEVARLETERLKKTIESLNRGLKAGYTYF